MSAEIAETGRRATGWFVDEKSEIAGWLMHNDAPRYGIF